MGPRLRTSLFILLSFLLGAVSGVFGGKYLFPQRWGGGGYSHKEIRKEFSEKLQLDSNQQARVDSIVESRRKNFDEIRKRFGGEFRAQRESLRAEIRTLLSPEQSARYEQYVKEMERKEVERRKRYERRD